uniref:Uncharacterized protein n=1 Tax=Rhizophora mucronata TaxID=61149 RepID=A0A2P2J143_RHIMU
MIFPNRRHRIRFTISNHFSMCRDVLPPTCLGLIIVLLASLLQS